MRGDLTPFKRSLARRVQRFRKPLLKLNVCGLLLGLAGLLVNPSFANEVVGKVTVIKGIVTAKVGAQPKCLLTPGAGVYLQDQLETHDDSFVVIQMRDNTKLTMRPGQVLQVETYQNRSTQQERDSTLVINKLRELSGLMGRSRPAEVNEKSTATIGIRGPITTSQECTDRIFSSKP